MLLLYMYNVHVHVLVSFPGSPSSASACYMTFDPVKIAGQPERFWHVNDNCDVRVDMFFFFSNVVQRSAHKGFSPCLVWLGKSGLPFQGESARSLPWTWTSTIPEHAKER